MIKKISAILLALVLCLSVVVVPASALEDGQLIGFRVELDSETYKAGDTVTVNLYTEFAEGDYEWTFGAIVFGMSDVFVESQAATSATANTVKATATGNETYCSIFKAPNASTWGWQTNATILQRIQDGNTEEENATYEKYLKVSMARNTNGSHEFASNTKRGITSDEMNAETDPMISFKLTLAQDITDGTEIAVGITSGTMTNYNYTYIPYLSNPGTSTATVKSNVNTTDLSQASATATIGAAIPELNVAALKQQIKFTESVNKETGEPYDSIAFRVIADLTNFEEIFGSAAGADDTTEGMADGTYITEAGFLYNKGADVASAAIDATAAEAQIASGSGSYTQQKHAYISTTSIANKYAMACVVYDIPVADVDNGLVVVAYVKYMQNGVEKTAMCTAYEGTFEALYNQYK